MEQLLLRPHHILCIPRYYYGGYDKEFSRNFRNLCKTIRNNPNIKIKVSVSPDLICQKCKHLNGSKCNKRPNIDYWIKVQDNKVLKILKIQPDSVHIAKEIFKRSIDLEKKELEKICNGCEYLPACQVNNSFKKDLKK